MTGEPVTGDATDVVARWQEGDNPKQRDTQGEKRKPMSESRFRIRTAALVAAGLLAAGCGSAADDAGTEAGGATTATTATTAPTTTAPTTTATTTAVDGASEAVPAGLDDPDGAAVAAAWSVVFDSATAFDDKAPHLAEAESLRSTIETYAATGSRMGGIALEPTAVTVTGDTATVTYDVLFGGNVAYGDLTGAVERVGGTWVVSRDEFCSFMASARTSC